MIASKPQAKEAKTVGAVGPTMRPEPEKLPETWMQSGARTVRDPAKKIADSTETKVALEFGAAIPGMEALATYGESAGAGLGDDGGSSSGSGSEDSDGKKRKKSKKRKLFFIDPRLPP